MQDQDRTRREVCRLRRAIQELLARHPDGLTRAEILNSVLGDPGLAGTRRNLEFQAGAILQALVDQGRIELQNESGTAVFKPSK